VDIDLTRRTYTITPRAFAGLMRACRSRPGPAWDNSGHALTYEEVAEAKEWLSGSYRS